MQELACNNFSDSVLPVKLKDISPLPPCWVRWGENFPRAIGKLINKAGVKKLLLLVVFTPWWETPTHSIVLLQSVPVTYREEAGCVFLYCPANSPPTHSYQRVVTHWEKHTHTYEIADTQVEGIHSYTVFAGTKVKVCVCFDYEVSKK